MPALLVLAFIIVPLVELLIVLQVGAAIGGWWTAALLVLDSLLGAYLLRIEGRRAWREFRTALEEGRWPGDEVAQGALVIVGGTLLLTPGFLTDVVGFLFLLAPTRRLVSARLRDRVARAATAPGPGGARDAGRGAAAGTTGPRPTRVRGADGEEVVLDVEVVEIRRETDGDDDPDDPPRPSLGPSSP
ncbi:MAG: FxsA family protein [Nitriliruptoraceae bacterium]